MFKRLNINWKFVPLKLHYFLWNAGTAPVVPFLSIYAKQIGFSSVIVGLIYTVLPIFGLLIKPIVGGISDRFKCQKLCFILAQIITAITFLGIFYSPPIITLREVDFSCNLNGLSLKSLNNDSVSECSISQLQEMDKNIKCNLNCDLSSNNFCANIQAWGIPDLNCSSPKRTFKLIPVIHTKNITLSKDTQLVLNFNELSKKAQGISELDACSKDNQFLIRCNVECEDYNLNNMLGTPSIKDDDAYEMYQFWTLLLLMVVNWMAQATVVSVGDAICFQMLGEHPEKYGYQRMFGALGWGLIAITTGLIVDLMSENQSSKNYIAAFYMAPSILILDIIVSYKLEHSQTKDSSDILKNVVKLLGQFRVIIFVLWCTFVGMCTAIMWNFLLWLVEELAKAQGCESQSKLQTLEGLIMGIECLGGELPFFFMSGWILKKMGHINAMTLVLGVIGVRFCLYSVLSNPWWFIPIEFLNGITFGLFYATMASYASIVTPPGMDATMQGLVSASFEGLGVSMGSFIAGHSFNNFGGSLTFRYFGISALIACFLHGIIHLFLKKPITNDEMVLKAKDLESKPVAQ